jgi:CRP-like cAMP-binding protein
MAQTIDALAQVPLFSQLSKKSLERISRALRERHFDAGHTVVAEGDEGVGMFIVTSGKAEITRGGTKLDEVGPGGFFGEMALLDHRRRSATVKTLEPTDCLALPRSDFMAELRSDPDLAIELLEVLSRRIRDLDERVGAASH